MLTAALLLAAIAACGFWLFASESGARAAFSMLSAVSGGALQAEAVSGRLKDTLAIGRLTIDGKGQRLELRNVRVSWRLSALLQRRFHLQSLRVAHLSLQRKIAAAEEPRSLPRHIALPLKLQLDQVQVDEGEINLGPLALITLGNFAFSLDFNGNRYQLILDRLALQSSRQADSVAGELKGRLTLATASPYAIDARFSTTAEGQVQRQAFGSEGAIVISGSLAEMLAGADLAVNRTRVNGNAVLRPFAQQVMGNADIAMRELDLAALSPALPHTRLDIRLSANENSSGRLTLRNAAAGTHDRNRMPLSRLDMAFSHDARRIMLQRIHAELGAPDLPAGNVSGSGRYVNGELALSLKTPRLDLQRLDQRLRSTQLAGTADIRNVGGRQEIAIALAEPLQKNTLSISASLVAADRRLTLPHAELKVAEGSAILSGQLSLAAPQAFSLQGRFRQLRPADLAQLSALPELVLTGDFKLQGQRTPHLTGELDFALHDSRIAGHPLQGEGNAFLRADSIGVPGITLAAGANRIRMQGELSRRESTLAFSIDAPQLDQLGPGFSGVFHAAGRASGSIRKPRLTMDWQAGNLSLPGQLQLDGLQGKAELQLDPGRRFFPSNARVDVSASGIRTGKNQVTAMSGKIQFSPHANAPLLLELDATGARSEAVSADAISVRASGMTGDHAIEATWHGPGQQWRMEAAGGLRDLANSPVWQGHIQRLDGEGSFSVRLEGNAPLAISAQRQELERLRLQSDAGGIFLEQLRHDADGIATRGRIEKLQLAKLLKFAVPEPPASTDLQLSGTWDVGISSGVNRSLGGSIALRRDHGDIVMLGRVPTALGLRRLEARATAANGRFMVRLLADGDQLGKIAVTADAQGEPGIFRITPQSQISGTASIDIPAIGWAAPLISPALITEGRLQSNAVIGGTMGAPQLDGQIQGSGLRVFFTDLGVDLRRGTLASRFSGASLMVEALRFESGDGHLALSGPLRFGTGKPDLDLLLEARRYTLLNRTDRRLTITGNSRIGMSAGEAKVSGEFTVDSGFFDIGRSDTPQLSGDVVIAGRSDKPSTRFPLALDLRISSGDGVRLRGRGLNAVLDGTVRIRNGAGETLDAQGTVQVVKGSYTAYGRELAIEQGVLRFSGPINNPGLNILAMRRGQEVEAGVAVRGTVLAPRVTLVSEPAVPDAEKLSWLVLGHGMNAVGENDLLVLQAAAGALLGGGESAGIQSQIAGALGLDTLSVTTSEDTLQERIITVGKQISSRLHVSYRQGLESATSALLLRYTLSRKLTLEAEAGARSALTLFYNIAFD